jgi:sulfite exporter TauE/SafE
MIESFFETHLVLLGLTLGLLHAFEADHIAAVTTLVARTKGVRRSSVLGALWGIGHTTSLLLIGSALLVLRISVPEALSALFETAVAVVLLALGVGTIRKVRRGELHVHTHVHGIREHAHLHVHSRTPSHDHRHTPFVVGLIHGLAGSGALAVATVAASKTVADGTLFIAFFGFGSVLGMVLLSASLGFILEHSTRFVRLHTGLMYGSGVLCIAVAFVLLPVPEFIAALARL